MLAFARRLRRKVLEVHAGGEGASEYLEDSNNGADLDPGIKVVTLDRGRRRARTVKVKV